MPGHQAQAIANEFIKLWKQEHPGINPNQTWLQKMVHIANGWNLAVNEQPLVNQPPEAWDNGPVFRSIWNHIRDWGYNAGGLLGYAGTNKVYAADISDSERAVINHVWKRYGQMSGRDLSRLTHEADTPWTRAYVGQGQNARLDEHDIRDHYIKLAMAGRAQAAH
ncbi:Panacea domain-containing protein [Devosia sp.]|uniref:Panacea domain-containing protein n=1 Tax=Devosia sp. TaxID=1871048 RepID=UPI00326426C3